MSTQTEKLLEAFAKARKENRPAFVAFLTAGFPEAADTVPLLKTLQESGTDVIELGIPFSDSITDGPTIQRSNNIALANGVNSLGQCLDYIKEARNQGVTVPIVLMSSYNPIMAHGDTEEKVVAACAAAGASGFIIPDLPPEESGAFRDACKKHGLSNVPLLAPTSTAARVASVVKTADSFIYAVSVTGVTGVRSGNTSATTDQSLPTLLANIQKNTDKPVALGFGISTNTQFRSLWFSDKDGYQQTKPQGLVVGSAIIETVRNAPTSADMDAAARLAARQKALSEYIKELTNLSGESSSSSTSTSTSTSTSSASASADNADAAFTTAEEKKSIDDVFEASRFGDFGGMYVPETLMDALAGLDRQYKACLADPEFTKEFESYYPYLGRPSSLILANRLTEYAGGARIWMKREDLNHTGSHKITNALGQALIAKRLGKPRVICETGAGQHGVATATVCAKLGLKLTVYMGAEDVKRQALNVFRMNLLGATVVPVTSGSQTLKDAINEAMRDWVTNIRTTHYLVGSAIGPHPFPTIVRHFQSLISKEAKQQLHAAVGKLPDAVVACVGGGSNAIGSFADFINDPSVQLIGVEAGGSGTSTSQHSATLVAGTPGVLHGCKTYLLQDKQGQVLETHSISAGLDYPGVGPEHSYLKHIGRATYVAVTDKEALEGFLRLSRCEGVIPALETSHAVYHAIKVAASLRKDQDVILTISGRGDKDVDTVTKELPKFFPNGLPTDE